MSLSLRLALATLMLPGTASAEWREYSTTHFVISSESPTADVEQLAERLESYDKLMRMATAIPEDEPVKVHIYEVPGTEEIEKALGVTDSGIAGFYDSNALGPYLVTPRKVRDAGRYFTPEVVLHHEYAHHFMLQYFPAIYPQWYVEGFAELIGSSLVLDDGRIGYGMPAKQRGHGIAANWVTLEDVLTKEKVDDLDPYSQGWALTHFFTFSKTHSSQLRQYLAAISHGQKFAAASKVFGDLSELNREARRYVTNGVFDYRPVKVEIKRPAIQSSRLMTAGEVAAVGPTIAFRDDELSLYRKESARKREQRLREENLERTRELSERYPNDPRLLYLLAEMESSEGNDARASAAVDRVLAINPGHARAMARKSLLMSKEASLQQGSARSAKVAAARAMAVKANRADTDDPFPLLAYYQSYNLGGEAPNPKAIEGLFQVVSMLPRDYGVRQLLVDQLARDKRYDEAIAWLMPIANSPHESPRREKAREQLEMLKAALAKSPVITK